MDQNKTISIRCEGQEYHDIEDLIPFQGKLKSISSDNFHKLKESIKSDGIPLGFHIWKQKDKAYIMDGHHRKMALQALKDEGYFIPPVPCNLVIAKSKKEAAKVILISNSKYSRVSEESLSDYMIDMELKVEDLENLDIPELNMNDLEPEQESKDGLTDDDAVPEVEQNIHGVTLGDIYQLGNHRLMCGDSTSIDAVEKLMDGQKADMVFTSPPYNANTKVGQGDIFNKKKSKKLYSEGYSDDLPSESYIQFAKDVLEMCFAFTDGFIFWNVSYNANSRFEYISQIIDRLPYLIEQICWKKTSTIPFKGSLMRDWEPIYLFSTSKVLIGINEVVSNHWQISNTNAQQENHKACFPVELPEKGLSLVKAKTSIIFEPFGGSGSTLIACEKNNRKCFMMELDPHYCSVIIERWQQFTGQKAVKLDAKMMR